MDLSKILDGTPEPPAIIPSLDFFNAGYLQPVDASSDRDYVLPVPMTPFQKHLTDDVVSLHYSDILRFFACGSLENEVLQNSLDSLYANTQLVATHPYLLVQHYLPPNLLLKDVHHRLARASGKFSVLVNLIELIRDKKINVALISRAGKSFDLIESLLLGRMINYKRYSGTYLRQSSKSYKKYSTIHLFPSAQSESTYVGSERFDLVIAFDLTFNPTDSHIQALRTQSRPPDTPPAPIIRLIPYYSSEHIIYKLQSLKNEDETLYMKRVVAAIVVLRGRAGSVPVELRPYYALGLKFLTPWISDPIKKPWPLPPVPEIQNYSAQNVEKSLLTEVNLDLKHPIDPEAHSNVYYSAISSNSNNNSSNINSNSKGNNSSNNNNHNNNTSNNSANTNGANSHEIVIANNSYPSATTNGAQNQLPLSVLRYQSLHDLSHSNIHRYLGNDESEKDDFYQAKRLKRERYSSSAPETALSFLAPPGGGLGTHQLDRGQILTHKILRRLESITRAYDVKEAEVQSLTKTSSHRQVIYEELSDENSQMIQKIKTLEEKLRIYDRKAERHDVELENVAKNLATNKDELNKARQKLKDGSPELVQFEMQREKIETLQKQKQRADERAKARTEEHDYMCGEYQKASNAAKEASEEVQSLKKANSELQEKLNRKVNGLRSLSFDEERKARDDKIKELEAKILSMEDSMKRLLENERLQPTRSRYGIRNSSTSSRRNNSPSVSGRRNSPSVN